MTNSKKLILILVLTALAAAVVVGCGGSSKSKTTSATPQSSKDAVSAATGDIPDNQAFLIFKNTRSGYSIKYPEGWAQKGNGKDVTFSDKGNRVQVTIRSGGTPTPATVAAGLQNLKSSGVKAGTPARVSLKHGPAIKASYTTLGAVDQVTGKRPQLTIDRYVYAKSAKVATLDLATPKGVDNVDAYRLISQSFQWK